MMELILGLFAGNGNFAIAVAGVIAAIVGFFGLMIKARRDGYEAQRYQDLQADTKAVREAREIEDAVAGREWDSVKVMLKRWKSQK
jgi:hypothetical protein